MIRDMTTHIGVLYVRVFIAHARSLKDKRMVLKSLKDRIRVRHNVSVAELDGLDKWQTATLGFAMIGNDNRYINGALEDILCAVEGHNGLEVGEHRLEFL